MDIVRGAPKYMQVGKVVHLEVDSQSGPHSMLRSGEDSEDKRGLSQAPDFAGYKHGAGECE